MVVKAAAVLLLIIAILFFFVGWLVIGKKRPSYSVSVYLMDAFESILMLIVAGRVLGFW